MSVPSTRRRRKQLARRRRIVVEQRANQQARAYARIYPRFEFDVNGAPGPLVDLVRNATREIRFDNRQLFSAAEDDLYRNIRAGMLGEMLESNEMAWQTCELSLLRLGKLIFDRIPPGPLLPFIPFHEFCVFPGLGRLVVRFRSLLQFPGRHRMVYYSPHRPSINIDGRPRIVAFSEHAVRQTCSRIVAYWPSYASMGDAFSFFWRCLDYERCDLYPDQLAFTFFAPCGRGLWGEWLARDLLGDSFDPKERYGYRVGYCPAVVEGDFLIAKTLLVPGYAATPERALILRSDLRPAERQSLLQEADVLDKRCLKEARDTGLLSWFHHRGVPQILPQRGRCAPAG